MPTLDPAPIGVSAHRDIDRGAPARGDRHLDEWLSCIVADLDLPAAV